MKLRSNIGPAGRWARALSGILFLTISVVVVFRGFELGGSALRWTIGVLAAALGVFQIFEAVCGWCIARALGLRTPM